MRNLMIEIIDVCVYERRTSAKGRQSGAATMAAGGAALPDDAYYRFNIASKNAASLP